jgi:hypothetical protein
MRPKLAETFLRFPRKLSARAESAFFKICCIAILKEPEERYARLG